MGGAFFCQDVAVKPWKSWSDQLDLMEQRGLLIADRTTCELRLSQVNYYRLAGYARYFQVAPHVADNRFVDGTTVEGIFELYDADEDLRGLLMQRLARVEIMLRTRYAYIVAEQSGPYGKYLKDSFFSGASTSESMARKCQEDLARSRERFIVRYRDEASPTPYAHLPVWSAVEAFSFGTLSKCIERGDKGRLYANVAESLGVNKTGFVSRLRALVYLRNRCAHQARLWRHSVVDAGSTPNNIKGRAKRKIGQFDPRSVIDVLVSLDDLLEKASLGDGAIDWLLARHGASSLYLEGLRQPRNHRDGPLSVGHK